MTPYKHVYLPSRRENRWEVKALTGEMYLRQEEYYFAKNETPDLTKIVSRFYCGEILMYRKTCNLQ